MMQPVETSPDPLALYIARAIDVWKDGRQGVTPLDVLTALEQIRFRLTEAVVRGKMETR